MRSSLDVVSGDFFSRFDMDRTGRRDSTTAGPGRIETSAGKTVRVPKPRTQVLRVLLENESAAVGFDHVAG